MPKPLCVIFDMDGVLIDAREWHFEALNRALDLFGFQISRYDHLVTYDGLPTSTKLNMLTRERALPAQLHTLINDLKQQYTLSIVQASCSPTFHHQYALARLKAEGYRLALCSNSISRTIAIMMEKAQLANYMEFCLSNEDVSCPKPHPEIYIKAMARLDVSPQNTLVIEDNENGIKAAIASGAHIMRVAGPDDVTYAAIILRLREIEACHS